MPKGSTGNRNHTPRMAPRDLVSAAVAHAIRVSPAFAVYVDEIRATDADGLSAAEEARLGALIVLAKNGPLLRWLLLDGRRGAMVIALILRCGDAAAKEIAAANLALVIPVAALYVGQGIALPDLIGEGNIALVQAAYSFDYRRARYSTHATWKIWHALRDAMARKSRAIRVPHYIHDAMSLLNRARAHATGLGEEWPLERLAEYAGVPLAHAIAADEAPKAIPLSQVQTTATTGQGGNPGDDRPIEEQIDEEGDAAPDTWAPSPSEAVATSRALLAQLQTAIPRAGLTPHEVLALRHTFGLEGADVLSMPQIAALIGATCANGKPDGSAPRRLVNTALSKLRLTMGEPGRIEYRPRADRKPSKPLNPARPKRKPSNPARPKAEPKAS